MLRTTENGRPAFVSGRQGRVWCVLDACSVLAWCVQGNLVRAWCVLGACLLRDRCVLGAYSVCVLGVRSVEGLLQLSITKDTCKDRFANKTCKTR